jgi:hypothetical protein
MEKDLQIKSDDLSEQLDQGLQKARKKLIEKEKKNNGYLVIAGKDGKVKKIPAKDL